MATRRAKRSPIARAKGGGGGGGASKNDYGDLYGDQIAYLGAEAPNPSGSSNDGHDLYLPENTNQPPDPPIEYSCTLSSSGFAASDGTQGGVSYTFSPDPSQVLWTATANIQTVGTRGGQVSYATTAILGPLTIAGFLRSRWDLLSLFYMVQAHMREARLYGIPLRFQYPEREIDYSIYIQTISEIGIDMEQAELVAYQIVGAITEDHAQLNPVDVSGFDPRIPENVGWLDAQQAADSALGKFGRVAAGAAGPNGEAPSGAGGQEGTNDDEDTATESENPTSNSSGSDSGDPRAAREAQLDEDFERASNPWVPPGLLEAFGFGQR